MNYLMMLTQLSGANFVWLDVAFILCLFGVIFFRSNQIHQPLLFRVACLIFAFSLILPSFAIFVFEDSFDAGASFGRKMAGGEENEVALSLKIFSVIGPILFAMALFIAIESLIPRKQDDASY